MDAEQARQVDRVLRQVGIPGVVAPEDPENLTGLWRVYDQADPATRRDITADVVAALAAEFEPPTPRRHSGPTRGFVLPPKKDE
ncbi:hypothetical protein PZB75_11345 [Streptomyces sp. AM 4-1-1]|uniref:hypothetical protein n=1 Tax=unclassified Streptomyces TaxID=2593676 RepID=UPI0023B9FA12|nr:hypothetical protein [Streptomyces sp. AM 4-1-1]WEH33913.1 hypothetical protein PZB75_11345 [Streptomyces sp. AM 4-1-1]